jgi:RND family efflux transporter MFP subunit
MVSRMIGLRNRTGLCILLLSLNGCTRTELDTKFTSVPKPLTETEQAAADAALDTIVAETMVAAQKPWPRLTKAQGSLEADQISTVACEVEGQVIKLNFDIGDEVKAGDLIATIDPSDYELLVQQSSARLTQAKSVIGLKPDDGTDTLDPLNAPPAREARAVLDDAKLQVKRLQVLFDQKAIADVDLDAAIAAEKVAEARYASALNGVREKIAAIHLQKAELEIAQQQRSRTDIRSPINGRIQSRQVALGNYVSAGQPMFMIAVTKLLRYRASVPEKFAQSLAVGQKVRVKLSGSTDARESTIARIAPTLDRQSRSLYFEAYVQNDDESIRPGLFAESEIEIEPEAQAIVLPNSAIIRFAGIDKVWKVQEGIAREFVVQIGRRGEDVSEIIGGLNDGEIVLKDGSRGRVAKVRSKDDKTASDQSTNSNLARR